MGRQEFSPKTFLLFVGGILTDSPYLTGENKRPEIYDPGSKRVPVSG